MGAPVPSTVRVVKLYPGGAGPGRGLLGPNAVLAWPQQNPLSAEWYWIDATNWCSDISDTIGQVGQQFVAGDGAIVVRSTAISADGLQAGFLLTGSTPGITYVLRTRLTGRATGVQKATDIRILGSAQGAIVPAPVNAGTLNRDVLTVGGIPIYARATP